MLVGCCLYTSATPLIVEAADRQTFFSLLFYVSEESLAERLSIVEALNSLV